MDLGEESTCRRRVYIKFTNEDRTQEVLQVTSGQLEYRHDNGEISQVFIDLAGMGIKKDSYSESAA